MGLYSQPPLELLCRLIMRDNPHIAIPLDPTKVMVLSGPLTTGLGTSGRNARVTLNGKTGSGIVGRKEFFYDRINVGSLFNGINVIFEAEGGSTKVSDLLPALKEQYGIQLSADDLSNGNTDLGYAYTPTPVTFNIASTSLAYTGTLTATWTRKPVGIFPDSGPGSKKMLIGDINNGYFGVVSQAELFPTVRLYNALKGDLGSTFVAAIDNAHYWFKFALDGEYYFFPSANIFGGVSWAALNTAGYAKANAKFPVVLDTGDGKRFFQMRLPKMGNDDPMDALRGEANSDAARLFNKIHAGAYGTSAWDNKTPDVLGVFWWLNHRKLDGNLTSVFVTSMNQQSISSGPETNNNSWRPMLKVIDGRLIAVPMQDITGVAVGRIRAPVLTIDREPDPLQPKRVLDVTGTFLRSFPKPFLKEPGYNYVLAVRSIVPSRSVKSFPVTITVTVDTRIPLATADGELSGFR
ncbi:virion structural protein [Erwinia phage vB_EamM_ChrisDB]|uniref:virion structural protein n=1 Tax=Erwinia phage vB_EamM_ChrisDB TaxID=1883371 RepID=UPI00081C3268|nr:virion structural protein [Erwinia phage vB_EamM_ChrisDB]ANZ48730.1 putative virion structural protein [Erwinia phage vB_EamM_ChrisDB]